MHGLGGDSIETWRNDQKTIWPVWLAEDVPNLKIWTLSYDAGKSNWRSFALALADRGKNVYETLRIEPRLKTGELTFVAHSLGGLVVKQALRAAHNVVNSDPFAKSLIERTRRIVFLGTPHAGSAYASITSLDILGMMRRSAVLKDLERDNPGLRELNSWYREFERDHAIQVVVLTEQLPLKVFGTFRLPARIGLVVPPSSADPGTGGRVVPVEADHRELCKPATRNSEVYKQILDAVQARAKEPAQPPVSPSEVASVRLAAEDIRQSAHQMQSALSDFTQLAFDRSSVNYHALVDRAAADEINRLAQIRFLPDTDLRQEAERIANQLENGELAAAHENTRARGLALCARQLSRTNIAAAEHYLNLAEKFGQGREIAIAQAVLKAAKGNLEEAIESLGKLAGKDARSVQLILYAIYRSESEALNWLTSAGLKPSDLHEDGKYLLIAALMNAGRWDEAEEIARQVSEEDKEANPGLTWLSAGIDLALAISAPELRAMAVVGAPLIGADFPLAADEAALIRRRKAIEAYEKVANTAHALRCPKTALAAKERALWLSILDVTLHDAALAELTEALRQQPLQLRYLALALQMGLNVDLGEAAKEIDRQMALNGRGTLEIAQARFNLALAQPTPEMAVDYLTTHKEVLEAFLNREVVSRVEIMLLADAKRVERAKEHLATLDRSKLSVAEYSKLERIIAEAEGADPLEQCVKAYQETKTVLDLARIVDLLAERREWAALLPYANELFDRTKTVPNAEKLGLALYNSRLEDELEKFLEEHADLTRDSKQLRQLLAWSLYRRGLLAQAKVLTSELRKSADNASLRLLAIRIDIGTGDWESIAGLVEEEWQDRNRRSPKELLQLAQLASELGLRRTKDLVFAAAEAAPGDARVLVTCYHAAVKSGWESDPAAVGWMRRAIELSNESGPVQSASLDDILARQSGWSEHQNSVFSLLAEAKLPVSMAAKATNQPLINLYALTGLANRDEPDPRKRTPVPAFAGNRTHCDIDVKTIALEATALLTIEMIGAAKVVFEHFDQITIAHKTLPWLFEQQGKISFHQPSRVRDASALRSYLSDGVIKSIVATELAPVELVRDVGESLAFSLVQARSDTQNGLKSVVVHSYPVHKLGSLMKEEADLGDFERFLCGTSSLVIALKDIGELESGDADEMLARLAGVEQPWPHSYVLTPKSNIYLDGSTLSMVQHLGLLPRLARAGFKVYVCEEELVEAASLVRYGALAERGQDLILAIRGRLKQGILSGRVVVHSASHEPTDLDEEIEPTSDALRIAMGVDAVVSDDRFINKFSNIEHEGGATPVLTTLDILDLLEKRGCIDKDQRLACRSSLRKLGMIMVPVDVSELLHHLSRCRVVDGVLIETSEMKAIRESVVSLQRTDYLQVPAEVAFINALDQTFLGAMRVTWESDDDVGIARAKSSWLVKFIDVRAWAHRLTADGAQVLAAYRSQLMGLTLLCNQLPSKRKQEFLAWLDESVFLQLKQEDVESFAYITERVASLISRAVDQFGDEDD